MVAEAERAGRQSGWIVEGPRLCGVHCLVIASVTFGVIAGVLGTLALTRVIPGWTAAPIAITIFGLTGLSGIASFNVLRAHATLARRLSVLSQVLDAAPEAHLIATQNAEMGFANIAFDQLFPGTSQTPHDRIKRAVFPDEESREQFRQLRSQAAAGMHATATLHLTRRRDSDAEYVGVSVDPIVGHSGYSFWKFQDILADHETEAIVAEKGNTLSDLLDNASIGFCSVDRGGRFRFINQTLARWLGTSPSAIIASEVRLHDFLASPPPTYTLPNEPFVAQGGATQNGKIALKDRQGRILPAWIAHEFVGSGDKALARLLVCDLRPDREAEAAPSSSERFRQCFANAPVGVAMVDRFGRFEEANHAVGELFATNTESLKGQELVGLLSEEDRVRIAAKLSAAADGLVDPEPIEVRPEQPSDRAVMLYLSRLDSAPDGASGSDSSLGTGAAGGLMLHFIDVTEQKNLETQFAQSQKMQAVGQLAGGVAHDFNNLLTAMIGFCDLLLLRSLPSDPSFADIMQIKQNANRAANLVRQLLAFSRQQTLQPRVLNITDVLYELRHLLERLIGENIRLDVVHGRDLGLAKVDQGQLEQVIINLAINARDAMPGGGTLTIRTANIRRDQELRRGHEMMPVGDYVLIEVADNGIGISKENLTRIFDPFFSTKELGSGTGLGLSTVYGIVKQTDGFVFVESAPGRGAVFQIYLPRYRAVDGALSARADVTDSVTVRDLTGHGTIMLVEDDDPVRIFGARALRNKGYMVIEAKSGEAALEQIRDAPEEIDLLITDVVMPRMDGPALVRQVREKHPQMKVIFISGYTEDAFRQSLDSGSDIDFLPKPFSLKQLAIKVRDVLGVGAA